MKLFTHIALAATLACFPLAVQAGGGPSQPEDYGEGTAFIATLTGAQENAEPVTTDGMGYALLTFIQKTSTICVALSYSGLSGDAVAAHIHGPADPDENAPVLIPLNSDLPSPVNLCGTLEKDGVKALKAGRLYLNVHTAAHPGGEIRGQILPIKGPNYKDSTPPV